MKIMEIVKAQREILEGIYKNVYKMANGIELTQEELIEWTRNVNSTKELIYARKNNKVNFWIGSIITNLSISNWIIVAKIFRMKIKYNRKIKN